MPEESSEIIKIDADGVDVKEVMKRIDERIASRPSAPEYKEESIEELEQRGREVDRGKALSDPLQELTMDLQFARAYAEVTSDYPTGSNRKVIGPIIVLVKKVTRKLMRPYINAVFEQQREFNRQMLQIIENMNDLILRDRARSHPGQADRLAFSERWGPDFDLLAGQLKPVAALFEGAEWVVELGAGRGMFLRAALDSGLEAVGVEKDVSLAADCQERGLPVLCVDPLVYLEQVEPASVPAVFAYGLGERCAAHELHYLVNQLADHLAKQGKAVFLNHRPVSFFGGEAAFRDPSVERLVHPETLVFLLEKAGFSEVKSYPFTLDQEDRAKEIEAVRKTLKKLDKEAPGIAAAWEDFVAPPYYIVEARR